MKTSPSFSLETLSKIGQERGPCVLASPYYAFVDHAIPIASILDIPLITKEISIYFTFKHFYPRFKCQLKDWTVPEIIENYSTVFYGFSLDGYHFNETIEYGKENYPDKKIWDLPVKFIYHFHGCSDKCWFQENSHLTDANQLLFYGNRMVDLFKSIDLLKKIKSVGFVGNYRYVYYKKHKAFFDMIAQKEIFSKFKKKQFTLFYAPTWMDHTETSSIFEAYSYVLDNLPDDYNLLIKLHPNLSRKVEDYCPKKLYALLDQYVSKPNVQIVPLFPCIYPLLNGVDAYLGDYSSVGYDALSFDIPLFFINHKMRSPLHDKRALLLQAGTDIYPDEFKNLYSIIKKTLPDDFAKNAKRRREIYEYGFGKDLTYEETKERFKSYLLF